jgi:hypothetical protein
MDLVIIMDLIVFLMSLFLFLLSLRKLLLKRSKVFLDVLFLSFVTMTLGLGMLLDRIKVLPYQLPPIIATTMIILLVGYGLVILSRMSAKRRNVENKE